MTQRYLPLSLESVKSIGDNVFGFSMTLLAVAPFAPTGQMGDVLENLRGQWPAFFAYVTTFGLLGTLWYAFHVDLRYVRRMDRNLALLNLPLLFVATLQPFAARLFGQNLGTPLGVMVPALSALVYFLCLWARWSYVTAGRRLVGPDLSDAAIRATHYAILSLVAISLLSVAAAFVTPWLSLALFFVGGAAFYVSAFSRRVWPGAVAAMPAEEIVAAPDEA
jgi:TMEM175 potassium channel family protein